MFDPAELFETEVDQAATRKLLHGILTVAFTLALLSLTSIVFTGDLQRVRLLSLFSMMSALGLSYWCMRRSLRTGAAVLVVGLWCGTAGAMVALAGIHSTNWLIIVFLIVLTGWVLGMRWLLGITTASLLLAVGLTVAELTGVFEPTLRTSAPIVSVTVVGTMLVISVITASAYKSLTLRRDRALALAHEMAAQNETLAQRERDLEMIMNQVPAGIASFDNQSRLRMGNVHYAALFGARPEQLVGRAVSEYVPPDTLDYLMAHWERCLQGERATYRRENRNPVTGAITVVDVALEPEYRDGQVTGMFALLTDVTEKVASEATLKELNESLEKRVAQRTMELEAALAKLQISQEELARSETKAALSTLVASVSHELSTPIGNSLMTATTLVDEGKRFQKLLDTDQLKRAELGQFVHMVYDGNDLMQRNLQRAVDLLANFRQVANDQASEQRRHFDLATMVAEVIETLGPSLKRYPQKVVLDIAPGIAMDSLPGALGQVIINLTNNAFLHGFEGRVEGVFTISAQTPAPTPQAAPVAHDVPSRTVEGAAPKLTEPKPCVTLVFEDNGVGIAPDNLERLFEPFFSTKKGKGGTGLGMGIVQSLVFKTLGGSIHVQSTVGLGTRVEVRLPLVAPERHART